MMDLKHVEETKHKVRKLVAADLAMYAKELVHYRDEFELPENSKVEALIEMFSQGDDASYTYSMEMVFHIIQCEAVSFAATFVVNS